MKKEKQLLVKLFLTHLAIAIPVLLTSMLMTFYISHEMVKIEEDVIEQQVDTAVEILAQEYLKMGDRSVLLAKQPELRSAWMQQDGYDTLTGVQFLELQISFDNTYEDMFVTYGTGKAYASTGVSSYYNYFRYSREMLDSSVERGIAAVEKAESNVCILESIYKRKYLLYSMESKRSTSENVKVNFLVPAQRLENLFDTQYRNQYFEIVASDGSTLYIACDEKRKISFPEFEEWKKIIRWKSLGQREQYIDKTGMKITLYYDRDNLFINQWLMKVQIINWFVIIVGSVFTAYLSWIYSKKRIYEIAYLENALEGNEEQLLSERSAYNNLQMKILSKYSESEILGKRFQEESNKLKDKITLMIYEGLYRDAKSLSNAFKELGFDGYPKRYFVGLVSAKEHILCDQMPMKLKECLMMYVNTERQECLVFLCEIDSMDENRFLRRQFAEEIRNYLYQNGLSNVCIGMSRVYEEPLMIERAYREAHRSLDDILSGKNKDFCHCWENSELQLAGVLFENEIVSRFEDALYNHNLEVAKGTFQQMIQVTTSRECTVQNRYYLRYEIIQHLIKFLENAELVEKAVLIRECVNADITKEREFVRAVLNVLQRCLVEKEDDCFTRMLNYVNNNYQNFNLTAEEVAEVGGISKNYVSKIFRSHLNMSYIEYVTMVRMDKARTLLRTTDMKISDIAEQVGYINTVSFRRVFRDKFGENASEYRKKESEYSQEE